MGRANELQRVCELMTSDHTQGVVLAGRAGVGKTRVAREVMRLLTEAGLTVVHATGTHTARALPFGALSSLLPADTHVEGAVDDLAWLLKRSAAALVEQADGQPLVVSVDDAHLLDDASATLLHHAAVTGSARVLLTTRTGEPVPDAVVALWRDELAERVELPALPDETVVDLLSAALGGPVDPATAAGLAARAQGNVLFLRELVLGARQAGTLVEERGLWRLAGRLAPSDRLVELVESRLGDLAADERALLELVAYGEPLGQAELKALGDPALAESLERRGLLRSESSGRRLTVRLAHPLYGEVVQASVPAIRARAIARALAEAVEATGARRREDTLRVASWRLTGGGGSAQVLLAGAEEARRRYDFRLAERLARAALDAGAGFDAALLSAQLALLLGRMEDARRQLALLAAEAFESGDEAQLTAVAQTRIEAAIWTGEDVEGLVDDVLATVHDPVRRDLLEAARSHAIILLRGPRAAAEAAAPLIERTAGRALSQAYIAAGYGLGRLGRTEEAIETAQRGRAAQLATAEPLPWYPWYHEIFRALALQFAGRFAEADELVAEHYRQALADRSIEAQAAFSLVNSYSASDRGGVRTGARQTQQAIALNQELGRPLLVRLGYVHQARFLALAGKARQAQDCIDAALALPLPPTQLEAGELVRAQAWTAVAAGQLSEACRLFEQAVDLGHDVGDVVGVAAALHSLARIGRARDVRLELADVARHIDGRLAPARVAHTQALARDDAEALEAVSREFEAMGAGLLAAEAAADAATARRRADQPRAAAADEHRAGRLAHACEDPVTPALQSIPARAVLTPAERETALLAASGRSNKEIARALYLSVRTVENRLQRVYEKLGVAGRRDLHEALDGAGPGAPVVDVG